MTAKRVRHYRKPSRQYRRGDRVLFKLSPNNVVEAVVIYHRGDEVRVSVDTPLMCGETNAHISEVQPVSCCAPKTSEGDTH